MPTNINFLQKLANHRAFQSGNVETHFIEHHKDDLFVNHSSSALAKVSYSAARLNTMLVAACICEQEHSAFKQSPFGKLKFLV